jgi:DNA repair exonuclease SbcCD ATPase subunit
MDTEFQEVIVNNFGPFIGEHRLKLGSGPSLNFVKGRNDVEPRLGANGAGKSFLLNAVPWCLYGKTTNDLATTDIRPWDGKGQTSVTVKLISWDGDEGERHTITRTAGPNSLSIDGKTCSPEDVEKLIGMPLDVFRLAPFLGQGLPLFHDLPNREKLDFLVGVSQLDRWDGYSDRAKEKTQALAAKLERIAGEIDANKVRAAELKEQVTLQKKQADAWEEQRTAVLKEVNAKIKQLTKQAEEAARVHADVATKLDECRLTLKLAVKDSRELASTAHKAELAYSQQVSHAAQVQAEHERAKGQLLALKKERLCPSCGQAIKRESRYLENIEAVEDEIRKYAKEMNSTAVADAKKASDKAKHKARVFDESMNKLRAVADKLEDEERVYGRERSTIEVELKHVKARFEEYEADDNPHRGRLSELRKALKAANDDVIALDKEQADVEVKLERTRFWVKGFKDVRLFVLEDILEELEFATNAMLDPIGLVGWEVRYGIERETKSGTLQRGLITTVLSPRKKGDVKWKSWSGGEGQRLRIVGALALSDVLLARAGVVCNVEVLDEPTRGLSTEGVDDLCEFLADRARTMKKSIYLVDHKVIESTRFDRIITVRKTDKGSSIRE